MDEASVAAYNIQHGRIYILQWTIPTPPVRLSECESDCPSDKGRVLRTVSGELPLVSRIL